MSCPAAASQREHVKSHSWHTTTSRGYFQAAGAVQMEEQLMTLNPAILGEMESSVLVRNPPGSLHEDALRARLTGRTWKVLAAMLPGCLQQ